MTEETNLLDPPGGATEQRRRGAGWGGSHGTQGGDGDENDPLFDDFKRLARMLARISASLGNLINRDYGIIDLELRAQFVRAWPQAANNLAQAIRRLLEEAIRAQSASDKPSKLRRQLERAGLTGPMLRMKETSLNFYLDPIDHIVDQPLREGKLGTKGCEQAAHLDETRIQGNEQYPRQPSKSIPRHGSGEGLERTCRSLVRGRWSTSRRAGIKWLPLDKYGRAHAMNMAKTK